MKKQINPTIKAHLIRSAFYLLLLVAVCAIPFALAQRNKLNSTRHQSAANKSASSRGGWKSLSVWRAGRPNRASRSEKPRQRAKRRTF